MSRTYRAAERKNIQQRHKFQSLPDSARRVNKHQNIKKLELAAGKKGEHLDSRYYAMCHSKVRHTPESGAKKTYNGLLVVYKCDYCIHFHIGRKKST